MKTLQTHGVLWIILTGISILAAWALFSWQAILSLHVRWTHFDEAYAVGYPAVLLSLWWLIRHRQAIKDRRQTASGVALALLVGVLLIGVAARLVQLQLLQQLVALVSWWLIITTLLGWSVGRLLLFPVALVLSAIPLWDFLVAPLRVLTVLFSEHMLNWLAIPAHVDGFRITLPSGRIDVEGGCSGLNLFLAMVLVGLLFAESHYLPRERRALIVIVAAITGMIDNWVRVFLLVLIAHRSQMQSELVYHHGKFGWWIFVINLVPYFWLVTRIERSGAHVMQIARTRSTAAPTESASRIAGVGGMLVILLLTAWWSAVRLEHRSGLAVHGLTAPPLAISGAPTWLPKYSGQDLTQTWRLQRGAHAYDIVALTYLEQRAGKKLIYFSNRIADEGEIANAGTIAIAPGFNVNTAVINNQGRRYLWWFWWVDGSTSSSALKTKLLQLKANLFGDPSAALIVLSTVCNNATCPAQVPDVDDELRQILMNLRQLRAVK